MRNTKRDCNEGDTRKRIAKKETHEFGVQQYDGKYFINPGSATGAYSSLNSASTPSFILMAIQGDDIVIFNYMIVNGDLKIDRIDLTNKK